MSQDTYSGLVGREYVRRKGENTGPEPVRFRVVREHIFCGRVVALSLRNLSTGLERRLSLRTLRHDYQEMERRAAPRETLGPMPEQQP